MTAPDTSLAENRRHPINRHWVRAAIGVAALGYGMLAVIGTFVLPVGPVDQLQEIIPALIAAAAFVAYRRHPNVSSVVVLFVVWLQLTANIALRGSYLETSTLVFPLLIFVSGLLFGPRASLFAALISAISVPLAFLLSGRWASQTPALRTIDVQQLVSVEVVFAATTALAWVALRSYQTVLDTSERLRLRFTELFDHAPDGLLEVDATGLIRAANQSAARLLGEPKDRLLGAAFADMLTRAGAPTPADPHAPPGTTLTLELTRGDPPERRIVELLVGGERRPGDRHFLVLRDVTDRRILEDGIAHAQRLETIGRLAGSVAHDFNNLLTVVGGNASLLVEDPNPETREVAREILDAKHRGSTLTRQLLAFSRREIRQVEHLDLVELVDGLSRLLKRLLGEQHVLRIEGTRPAQVLADRGQLEQVVINLVSNARDAMPGGGEVRLCVRPVHGDEGRALGCAFPEKQRVLLEVADSGIGMPPAVKARLFEPFFTTKPRGTGTGLGLFTVKRIVDHCHGSLAVDSEPGRGTRLRAFFPMADGTTPAPNLHDEEPAHRRAGTGTILLVEDDPSVRKVAERFLVRAGYHVLTASQSDEALAHVASGSHIDLLLTDIVMPGQSGLDLAAVLRERRPDLRILYMSGYFESSNADAIKPEPGLLLQKPFTEDELLGRVATLLGGH